MLRKPIPGPGVRLLAPAIRVGHSEHVRRCAVSDTDACDARVMVARDGAAGVGP